ncbi:uncharacterized protein LOC143367808 [Andrena cerasifolii]|uniref:uncharacterized protein LOC143367808 n=1 Tax=Andrena cerasifolii TaxID=2819439 RepID=UPI0040379DFE
MNNVVSVHSVVSRIYRLQKMPTEYVRKPGSVRGQWTVENLTEAINRIEKGDLGVREASRYYGIPPTTIQQRRRTNNFNKVSLGPQGLLGRDNEKRLVGHILRLQEAGFAPDRTTIRRTAFEFAESLGLQHKFNTETRLAGYDWLASFLKRNKELTIGQAEGSSLGRPKSIENKEEVGDFFKLLMNIYNEHDLYTKPGNIFTVDETSCQLSKNPEESLTKGSNNIHCSTSDESVSVIACCSAEGVFLPPSLVIKGVRQVSGMEIGLPPGSKVYKNPKSSDISSEIFYQWLVEHFAPQKPLGKVLLLMDGHSSHQSSLEMFDFAAAHDIVLLCLPSHTTQAFQLLDRYIFKPFMSFYKEETQGWVNYHKKQIKRVHAGALVGNAWAKSATFDNAVNGFAATGIFPLNGTIRSEFNVSSTSLSTSDATGIGRTVSSSNSVLQIAKPSVDTASSQPEAVNESASQPLVRRIAAIETPSCSKNFESTENTSHNASSSKHLHKTSPAPKLEQRGKNQRRQSARIRDEEFAQEKKHNLKRKSMKSENRIEATGKSMKKQKIQRGCESEEDDLPVNLLELIFLEEEDCCLECLLNYSKTDLNVDWLKCIDCSKWMHKTCTMYGDRCNICGRREKLVRLNRIKN